MGKKGTQDSIGNLAGCFEPFTRKGVSLNHLAQGLGFGGRQCIPEKRERKLRYWERQSSRKDSEEEEGV